jgi:antitoxin component YwqK of YwqJK toxin-antitoxin module
MNPDTQKFEEFYDNGVKKVEFYLYKGKLIGVARTWYEDGGMRSLAFFSDGTLDGSVTFWHEDGRKEEISYEAGFKHGETKIWNENGELLSCELYHKDVLIERKDLCNA